MATSRFIRDYHSLPPHPTIYMQQESEIVTYTNLFRPNNDAVRGKYQSHPPVQGYNMKTCLFPVLVTLFWILALGVGSASEHHPQQVTVGNFCPVPHLHPAYSLVPYPERKNRNQTTLESCASRYCTGRFCTSSCEMQSV